MMILALGFYDYVTFSALIFILIGFMAVVLFFLGLPGRIAKQRNHPDADAVNLMGWLGFLGVVPWIQALIWAIKETEVVDIRRFPPEEGEVLRRQAEKFENEKTRKPKAKKNDSDQGHTAAQD